MTDSFFRRSEQKCYPVATQWQQLSKIEQTTENKQNPQSLAGSTF